MMKNNSFLKYLTEDLDIMGLNSIIFKILTNTFNINYNGGLFDLLPGNHH